MITFFVHQIQAQVFPPISLVYGVASYDDKLRSFNAEDGTFNNVDVLTATLPSYNIDWMNGIAQDPCTHKSYVIVTDVNVSGRILASIDLATANCTYIGNLGDNFSCITFDKFGQLYGVTGKWTF
ncbi:MAG: hypothetical protein IPK03_11135 [Bacteroidetes bacterium]|nr:hypothetical protein [Bacteroidota bacterium]